MRPLDGATNTMNRKRTIWLSLLLLALSGAAGVVSFNYRSGPHTVSRKDKTALAETVEGQEKLIGTWKLVRASVTPDFLKVPIPINTFDATGSVSNEHTYTIKANGSFFGSNYGYLGRGNVDIQGNNLTLTIGEGIITINDSDRKLDKAGKTITGTYHLTDRDTLLVEAFKYQDGIRYTFNLALVNP